MKIKDMSFSIEKNGNGFVFVSHQKASKHEIQVREARGDRFIEHKNGKSYFKMRRR